MRDGEREVNLVSQVTVPGTGESGSPLAIMAIASKLCTFFFAPSRVSQLSKEPSIYHTAGEHVHDIDNRSLQ